ncbi:kinesin [Novymonas esmeraldas]|uniref:Kinesin n=1 Tax=Novymonas esmeraldas TaxID=1808958 RepID=A0AAW0ENK7_9TRYP
MHSRPSLVSVSVSLFLWSPPTHKHTHTQLATLHTHCGSVTSGATLLESPVQRPHTSSSSLPLCFSLAFPTPGGVQRTSHTHTQRLCVCVCHITRKKKKKKSAPSRHVAVCHPVVAMAAESSSVLVAVRVRPFAAREDTVCCTVTVPDTTTIAVLDVPALIPSSTSSSGSGGGSTADGGVANASIVSAWAGGAGAGAGGGGGGIEALRHSYSFDKIFWSVAPAVLPFAPLSALDTLASCDDGDTENPTAAAVQRARPSRAQRGLLTQYSGVARHLPCFAAAPTYDDQQSVYAFVGPRLCDAVMSGFNACLFAYGQTGSGKSYSMIGPTEALSASAGLAAGSAKSSHGAPPTRRGSASAASTEEQGIMPRLCTDLFRLMREEREKDEGVTYSVELSFLEIYCEKVRDLLATTTSAAATAATGSSSSGGGGGVNANAYFSAAASSGGSLRIRQHPSQGPYVEGLSHVKVRDAAAVLKYLLAGLRDRATAETNMNEHSSRSHAILQLHITKVMADTEEATGSVVTRTRTCKVNMVDLAGSERVSQSGVTGDRFEEAKNINLSLSTLGRVIQQLSEKQAGKHVIPAYRDSVLTWLLSDSLGGNSKTIMLATVAPSAYCYQQTLNTLRFAGVAKKVVNVATVNEDRHFQELITELRRQIVRLTLQLESGKAAEVHLEKIDALKRERERLLMQNDALKVKAMAAADTTVLQALRKRVADLEAENAQLGAEKQSMQERMLASTGALRDEVAQQRAEVIQLHETLSKREAEVTDWASRYRALVITTTSPSAATASPAVGGAAASGNVHAEVKEAHRALHKAQEELKLLKAKALKSTQDATAAERARQEAADAAKAAATQLDEYRVRYEECKRQLDLLHERMQSTVVLLETTQCELSAVRSHNSSEHTKTRAVEDALEATHSANAAAAAQLEQMRSGYLEEKQRNVELLLRVAQVEQERSALRRSLADRVADTCELEQLLLEEAETSERYYTRLRFHRYAHELQHQCMVQLLHLRDMADRRRDTGASRLSTASAFAAFQSPFLTPRLDDRESSCGAADSEGQRRLTHPASANLSTRSAAHDAATSARLLHLQRVYECQCEEAQGRAAVEQECAMDLARLLSQKVRLRQLAVAGLSEQLAEVTDAHRALGEEVLYYKQKARAHEEAYAEEVTQRQRDGDALQIAEMERMRLERKVGTLMDVNAELEGGRDSLIAKVAQLQEQLHTWQTRCADAERIAAEVQDLLFPAGSSTAASSPTHRASDSGDGDAPQRRRSAPQREAAALASRVREAQDALEAKAAMEQQCDAYRAELGALRAKLESVIANEHAAQQQLSRSDRAQQQTEARLTEANAQLMQEISTVTCDYESRIKQQQTMMNTLRHALEEETSMADMCRQSAQRAEAARQAQDEELIAAREAAAEVRRQREATSSDYHAVQAELDELRTHYHALELRLMELREREPELYVLLERGLDEDTVSWLDKVRGEKARLQRQQHEARRLNDELLDHVRVRHTRLRSVQKQLTDVSFPGDDEGPGDDAEDDDDRDADHAEVHAGGQVAEEGEGPLWLPTTLHAVDGGDDVDAEELGCTLHTSAPSHRP